MGYDEELEVQDSETSSDGEAFSATGRDDYPEPDITCSGDTAGEISAALELSDNEPDDEYVGFANEPEPIAETHTQMASDAEFDKDMWTVYFHLIRHRPARPTAVHNPLHDNY